MIVKGYKLFKMLNAGKIADGTIVKIKKPVILSHVKYIFERGTFWEYRYNKRTFEEMHLSMLVETEFEILEKENKKIEEYNTNYTERCIDKEVREKLNEVIRAVNKLNGQNENTNCISDIDELHAIAALH